MNNHTIKQINRLSLRDQVYQALRKAIITLELEPGQRISDMDLAAQFGVSRTPVREALKRLEDEGLVESIPGSATRVTRLNGEEAKYAFVVVAALHALAARLAVPLLTETDIQAMEQSNAALRLALEQKDVIQAIEADTSFHDVMLKTAGNPEIYHALERIMPKIHRLELAQFGSLEGLASVEQHQQIIAASKKGDSAYVSKLVEENWLSLGKLLTKQT